MSSKALAAVALAALLYAVPLSSGAHAQEEPEGPEALALSEEDATFLFREGLRKIQKHGIAEQTDLEFVRKVLKTYLEHHDRYAEFFSPAEFRAFGESQSSEWVGLGLDVIRREDGRLVCYPYDSGSAHAAGIRLGDLLITIAGERAADLSPTELRALAIGETGKMVDLVVRRGEEQIEYRVMPMKTRAQTVFARNEGPFLVARITRFIPSTARELDEALKKAADPVAVILDLRGNPGGDLDTAPEIASLFVRRGTNLGLQKYRDRERVVFARAKRKPVDLPLFIVQDARTASAAEFFTASLVENGRAESIGARSYGKGMSQEMFGLSDGSGFLMTTSVLFTPNGVKYDGRGLTPSHEMALPAEEPKALEMILDTVRSRLKLDEPFVLAPGTEVFAVEKAESYFAEGGECIFYLGEVTRVRGDTVRVLLKKRCKFRYRPEAPMGVDARDWWALPPKRYAYGEIGFPDWRGLHQVGSIVIFHKTKIYDPRLGPVPTVGRLLEELVEQSRRKK